MKPSHGWTELESTHEARQIRRRKPQLAQSRVATWGLTSAPPPTDRAQPATAAAGEQPCPPPPRRPGAEGGGGWPMHATAQPWHAEGLPSPTEALRCLHACSSSAQTKDCKRCKRNSGLGPWSERMDLTPASTAHAHTGGTRGPKPLCSLALSLAGKKKGFSTSPRTLAITDRGDRIRTCDLVLPKHPRYQAAPRPVFSSVAGDGRCIAALDFQVLLAAVAAAMGSGSQLPGTRVGTQADGHSTRG